MSQNTNTQDHRQLAHDVAVVTAHLAGKHNTLSDEALIIIGGDITNGPQAVSIALDVLAPPREGFHRFVARANGDSCVLDQDDLENNELDILCSGQVLVTLIIAFAEELDPDALAAALTYLGEQLRLHIKSKENPLLRIINVITIG